MEKLKILAIGFVYNEIEFIKYKHKWSIDQDIDLYVIDNMSNDGTWEYLQENKIKSHRVDTNETFDLLKLQNEVLIVLNKEKPNWFIYNGCDEFFFTKNGLRKDIEISDKNGFDAISLKHLEILNTGENIEPSDNIFDKFFYGAKQKNQIRIKKYSKDIKITGDNLSYKKLNFLDFGLFANYGMTKNKNSRMETLKRRRKAWDSGLPKNYGQHYEKANLKNWEWDKTNLTNLKNSEYSYYLDKMINYGKN